MTMKKRGLGRGLDVLIKSRVVEPEHDAEIVTLPVSSLRPNTHQPRQHFDQTALQELAASIKSQGLIQPVLVRPLDTQTYEIVAGERRWRACGLAGLDSLQCIVRDMDDNESMAIALIENLQREDLNPIEEARALGKIKDHFAITQEDLADKIGKSRPAVTNCLRLLRLPDDVQALLEKNSLSAGHARALLGLDDAGEISALAALVVARGLTVRATEDLIKKRKRPDAPQSKARVATGTELSAIVERMQAAYRISCSGSATKGKIVLAYASTEERERVTALLASVMQEKTS